MLFQWKGYEWETNEGGARIHPDRPDRYCSDKAVVINDNDELELHIIHDPQTIEFWDGRKFDSTYGIGLVTCKEKFRYGKYSIKAKLPKGSNLWPAFWMYSWDSWPPEVDIFEGYSNKCGSYKRFDFNDLFHWKIESNYHLLPEDGSKRAMTCRRGVIPNPTKHFIEYTIIWSPYVIMIEYNDELVRVISNSKLINYIENHPMRLILNNSIRIGYTERDFKKNKTPFIINDFKYEPCFD